MSDYVSPYVALSADSERTEAEVREARVMPLPNPAADVLTPLLENVVCLKDLYNEAVKKSARFTSTDNLVEHVDADIEKRIAYEALDIAEMSYNEAIKEHVARLREARNASA